METITLREYDAIPVIYDEDGNFDKHQTFEVGDYYIMRETDDFIDRGSVVSVYEVVGLTETGHESKITVLKVE